MFDFWKEHLAGAPSAIDLPTDRPRPSVQTFNGATYGFQFDESLTESVDALAKESSVTLFTALLSAYDILMHRYCQQDDIVVVDKRVVDVEVAMARALRGHRFRRIAIFLNAFWV